MKKVLIFAAIMLIVLSQVNLEIDLRSVKYSRQKDCWNVDIPVIGGSGSYSYEFDLPQGWRSQGNRIRIPTTVSNQLNSQFVARCKVRDVQNNLLQRSLVFKPFSSGSSINFQIADREYFFGHPSLSQSSLGSSSTSEHGLDILKRLGSLTQRVGSFDLGLSSSVGTQSRSTLSGSSFSSGSSSGSFSSSSSSGLSLPTGPSSSISLPTGSFSSSLYSSSFSSFPAMSQLQRYISGGDIVQIIKAIQIIVSSNAKCQVKSAYLSDFLGRIYASIQVKKFALKQLKKVVQFAVSQVQKLTLQITTVKSQQQSIKLQQIKAKLDQLIVKLRAAYDQFNKANSTCQYSQNDITILQREITQINRKYFEVEDKLSLLIGQSKSIDLQIAEYQLRIKKLRQRKTLLGKDIIQAQRIIKERDDKIVQIKTKITNIKNKIVTCSGDRDRLKSVYLSLEVQITSIQQQFKSAEAKFSQYEQRIVTLTMQAQRYRKQTSDLQIKQVFQCVQNLESAIVEIKQSIEFVSFYCVNGQNIEIFRDKFTDIYKFDQDKWFSYIDRSYNSFNTLADQIRSKIMAAFNKNVIEVSTVNVFSDKWKNNYGSCFQKDIQSKATNYKTQKSWSFNSDFSCSANIDRLQSKAGTIQSITASTVRVRGDDGKEYQLRLGSCSKFEGAGKDFIPIKGQNILWKGSRDVNSYNLHTCTCF